MTTMEMIFEDPPYGCWEDTPTCDDADQIMYKWTNDPSKHRTWVTENGVRFAQVYTLVVAIHEFGHTLGLPDFYAHTEHGKRHGPRRDGLSGETAIMNRHDSITDKDIAQLHAIYLLHTKP